jgi:hypothetical protein
MIAPWRWGDEPMISRCACAVAKIKDTVEKLGL